MQNWDNPDSKQRWTLKRASDGLFTLTNDADGMSLALDGEAAVLRSPATKSAQQWRFKQVLTL